MQPNVFPVQSITHMLYNIASPSNNFMQWHAYHMISVEIINVHAGQILPCGQVTGNKEFTIGGLWSKATYMNSLFGLFVVVGVFFILGSCQSRKCLKFSLSAGVLD